MPTSSPSRSGSTVVDERATNDNDNDSDNDDENDESSPLSDRGSAASAASAASGAGSDDLSRAPPVAHVAVRRRPVGRRRSAEDGVGRRRRGPSGGEDGRRRTVSGAAAPPTAPDGADQALIDAVGRLKLQIALQQEKLDAVSLELRRERAGAEALAAEKAQLAEELARARGENGCYSSCSSDNSDDNGRCGRQDGNDGGRRFSISNLFDGDGEDAGAEGYLPSLKRSLSLSLHSAPRRPGHGGSMRLLLDRNAKLMAENVRLQAAEASARGAVEILEQDRRDEVDALRREHALGRRADKETIQVRCVRFRWRCVES